MGRIVKSDDEISPVEIAFLTKVLKKYHINRENFKIILKFPEEITTFAHLGSVERIKNYLIF